MSRENWRFKVMAERCESCIFHPGNRMHLRRGRVASMVAECREVGGFIPCHERMTYVDEEEDGEPKVDYMESPVCNGFYEAHGHVSQAVQIAQRLEIVEFV